jgi:acetoin utilization deacetylase AcuC-like enzyme
MNSSEQSQKPTALITGTIYTEHETGHHPENAGRLMPIFEAVTKLKDEAPERFVAYEPEEISADILQQIHDPAYLEALREFCESGGRRLDADTKVSAASYRVALNAAGGLVRGVEAVLSGEAQNAFALVRPPGHHAEEARGMGFCLINNIAIAARHLTETHGLSRILIVDWDVHHGNGTQAIFYNDPRVLFYSTHQSPLYPGTGALEETGMGKGRGYTANLPLPPNAGDEVMEAAFTQILEPLAARYKPEFILVSAGYDAHWRDALYMTALKVTTYGFARLTERVKQLAETYCNGRLALTLEGGYDPEALGASVEASLRVLAGETPEQAARIDQVEAQRPLPADHEYIRTLLKEARKLHSV